MTKKLPQQTRNNRRTFTMEEDVAHQIEIKAELQQLNWCHKNATTSLFATDEGVTIICSAPNKEGLSTKYTIELKDVPLLAVYSCLMNVNITGICLIELENGKHTLRSALRQMQLAALVRRGLVTLKIRELNSFDPFFESERCLVFTLEISGIPFSSIENFKSRSTNLTLREIFSFKDPS